MRIAEVACPVPVPKTFHYEAPAGWAVEPGRRVRVPFGPRRLTGVVLSVFEGLLKIKDSRLIPVNGDARQVREIARRHGVESADVIVSGIPFAFLSSRGRHELLKDTNDMLAPGGRFVVYQVTTHLIGLLEEYFRKVKTQFEVRNIPPHFVFTAFK